MRTGKYSLYSNEAGPCVLQVRTKGVDGYEALQLGFDDKTRHSTKAALGHFKAGTVEKKVVEFQNFATEQNRRSYRCFYVC
jgi:large subunit ribosomal protein L3